MRRTVKFLTSICLGRHIVSEAWLPECKRVHGAVNPETYTLVDKAAEKRFAYVLVGFRFGIVNYIHDKMNTRVSSIGDCF